MRNIYYLLAALLLALLLFPMRSRAAYRNAWVSDPVLEDAMATTYKVEGDMQDSATSKLRYIAKRYRLAAAYNAIVFATKYEERKAMLDLYRFNDSQENYYYNHIHSLLQRRLLPRLWRIGNKCLKFPDRALYWGPYLYGMSEDVMDLCHEFESIVTNGRLDFNDLPFLAVNAALGKYFDGSMFGGTDIRDVLRHLGDINLKEFGTYIGKRAKETVLGDLQGVIGNIETIANAGIGNVHDEIMEASKLGKVFHMSAGETEQLISHYGQYLDTFRGGFNWKALLRGAVGVDLDDTAANLFVLSDYSLRGFMTDYLKSLDEQYYTQRFYIVRRSRGSRVLTDWRPVNGGKFELSQNGFSKNQNETSSPVYVDNEDMPKWSDWYYVELQRHQGANERQLQGVDEIAQRQAQQYVPTSTDLSAALRQSLSHAGWSPADVVSYEKEHPGHKIQSSYTLRRENRIRRDSYYSRRGIVFLAYNIKLVDEWDYSSDLYEDYFDSRTMDMSAFQDKMEAELQKYRLQEESNAAKDSVSVGGDEVEIVLLSDAPRYYSLPSDTEFDGAHHATFTATCPDGNKLAEGSFSFKSWKQKSSSVGEVTRQLAGSPETMENDESSSLLNDRIDGCNTRISELGTQYDALQKEITDLNDRIYQANLAGDRALASTLTAALHQKQSELNTVESERTMWRDSLNTYTEARKEYYSEMEEPGGKYRIPHAMTDMASQLQISWSGAGAWIDEATFERAGISSRTNGRVIFRATIAVRQGVKKILGIPVHRGIVDVNYEVTSSYETNDIVKEMDLDETLGLEANKKLMDAEYVKLLMLYPDCKISVEYTYTDPERAADGDDTIHLLWWTDRLAVARTIDNKLRWIDASLAFFEMQLDNAISWKGLLTSALWKAISPDARAGVCREAFARWTAAAGTVSNVMWGM